MDSLREKVARALCDSGLDDVELEDADAAIAAVMDAMREPSEAMLDAGASEMPRSTLLCAAWKAMLSAFLQEQSAPTDGE